VKILPNIKSAKKRVKIASIKRAANMSQRSSLRTILKKTVAVKKLDEAASKGLIHKNQAARRKSRLMKKLNALAQ
jgi:small subunit ribosomal protein S20